MRLKLPLEGPPAEHREADKLPEEIEAKGPPPPIIYTKGMDPYTDHFLQKRMWLGVGV